MTAQLLTLPLALLKHRFPHLFPHPPLLAHTVYQTVVFDDSIKRGGFSSTRAWKATRRRQQRGSDGGTDEDEWEGLTEEILNTDDWFERWWQGEKECELLEIYILPLSSLTICAATVASEQYEEITSSPEAWTLVDVSEGGDQESESALERRRDFKPTIGARQVRALVEQVAGESARASPVDQALTVSLSRSIRFFAYFAAQVPVPGASAITHPGFVSQAYCQLPGRVRDTRLDVCQSSTGCTSGTLTRKWTRYGYR